MVSPDAFRHFPSAHCSAEGIEVIPESAPKSKGPHDHNGGMRMKLLRRKRIAEIILWRSWYRIVLLNSPTPEQFTQIDKSVMLTSSGFSPLIFQQWAEILVDFRLNGHNT